MNNLESFVIPVTTDEEILGYFRKTSIDEFFNESVGYSCDSIEECISFMHETYELDTNDMLFSIKTKKPVNNDLTLLFRQNNKYLILNAEVDNENNN